jgi:hypothetical protein
MFDENEVFASFPSLADLLLALARGDDSLYPDLWEAPEGVTLSDLLRDHITEHFDEALRALDKLPQEDEEQAFAIGKRFLITLGETVLLVYESANPNDERLREVLQTARAFAARPTDQALREQAAIDSARAFLAGSSEPDTGYDFKWHTSKFSARIIQFACQPPLPPGVEYVPDEPQIAALLAAVRSAISPQEAASGGNLFIQQLQFSIGFQVSQAASGFRQMMLDLPPGAPSQDECKAYEIALLQALFEESPLPQPPQLPTWEGWPNGPIWDKTRPQRGNG